MKYVQRYKDRHGVYRLYLRKAGVPKVALCSPWPEPGQECGSALEAEVNALLAKLETRKPAPGTLRGALRAYELEDADFKGLAESTRYSYRLMLKEFEQDLGDVPIVDFTPAFLLELRDAWAERGYRAANYRRQILKNVLARSLIDGTLEIDPFARVGGVRRPSQLKEPHPLWSAAVLETVVRETIAKKRYGLARAVVIGRYTGARRGDLVKITKAAQQGGRFQFLSGKRRVPVDLPEDPQFSAWLAEIPDSQPEEARQGRKVKADTDRVVRLVTPASRLVFNLANEPYTEDGLGLELRKVVQALHKLKKLPRADFDLHGLRHTRGVEIALSGASDAQGAALMGHWSPTSFTQYRRQADRVRMSDDAGALILAFRDRGGNGAVSNQVSNKCLTGGADEPDMKKAQVKT